MMISQTVQELSSWQTNKQTNRQTKCVQRAQNQPRPKCQPKVIRDSNQDFRQTSGCGSGRLPHRSQNVVDSLPCRRQSFRRVSWKSAGDCMRNAQKSPKIPYSVTVHEWWGTRKSDPESTSGFGSTPKFTHFQRITSCPRASCLVDIHKRARELSCSQTDRQTHRQTDRQTVSHSSALAE